MPSLVASRYRLGEQLGRGGMGRVWLARDEILDRDVAIKQILLQPELIAADRDAVHRRTLREARAAARLSHPAVVQIYDVLELDGATWIVMEYVPSRTLQEAIRADGPLDPGRAARIGLELLGALEAAHRAGVDHRDVKPANVLLADDGRILLTDFGIATIDGDNAISTADLLIGSPEYMSPERARHEAVGLTSDLWSLGATLYTAVEGRSPFGRASTVATLTALAADDPDPPRQAGALEPVLDGLLRKNPAVRIDAAETRRRLRAAATSADVPASKDPAPVREIPAARPSPPAGDSSAADSPAGDSASGPSRLRAPAVVAVLVVLVLGAGVIWLVNRHARPSSTAADAGSAAPAAASTAAPASSSSSPRPSSPRPSSPRPSSPTASPSATGSTAPATSASAGGGRPALPAGWRLYRDRTGFSLYVPGGWTRSREGSMVYFRAAGRVLGIDQSDHPKSDPVADWRSQAAYRVARGDFPNYHQIRIDPVKYWRKAADWEFTFTRGGVRQHVDNRGFVVSKSQAYGIYWQTSDAAWSSAEPDLSLVYASFRPASDA